MNPADRRLARDIAATTLGLTALVAAVAVLLAMVENAELGRVPSQIGRLVPVLAAMAAVRVAVVWDETGRMVALQSVGVAPLRMCAVAGLAAMATAVLITGLVALAPDIPGREWVFIGGEQVLQGYWNGDSVDDIRVVRLDGGRVVGVGAADRARWAKGWTVEGESAQIWVGDEARPMGLSLPAPDVWLEAASSSSSAMTLAVRVHGIVGGGLLAWFAMAMALRGQRGVGIAACALWTLISAVGMSAVATGALSLWTAVLAPLAIAVAAVIYASCRTT